MTYNSKDINVFSVPECHPRCTTCYL